MNFDIASSAFSADTPSTIHYDAPKPDLADEDKQIGALKLDLSKDKVVVTPVAEVFAR